MKHSYDEMSFNVCRRANLSEVKIYAKQIEANFVKFDTQMSLLKI